MARKRQKDLGKFAVSADFFRTKREEAGISQEALGESLGISSQTVSNWERGLCRPPSERLYDIMVILEIPKTELQEFLLQQASQIIEEQLKQKSNKRRA